jgi:hypothetical protein
MPRTKGSKNRKTILKEHEKTKKPPVKRGRPKGKKRKTKAVPIKSIKAPSERTRIPVVDEKPSKARSKSEVPEVPKIEKGKKKAPNIAEIERELAPTLVHRERKKKKERDESWEIRQRREPYYDPKIPLETTGGFRRKYTVTLEEDAKYRFEDAVGKNSLYGSYVLNELIKMYSAGKIEIKPNYDDIAKWPWGLLEPNGEVIIAKPGTPVPIWDEWDTQKADRLKREAQERKEKKGTGTQKSFKCPHCKKGRGTLHTRAEDSTDKWYECDKCHKTWRRMRVASAVGEKEASKDIVE